MQETIEYEIVTGLDRDDLLEISDKVTLPSWPEFMLHDTVANKYWAALFEKFPGYQFVLIEKGTEDILAAANSIPVAWDGELSELPEEGWDWVLEKGFEDLEAGISTNLQSALQIVVPDKYRGTGLSGHVLQIMKSIGTAHGKEAMIAPVRPNMKSFYPLTSIDNFVTWQTEEGLPFDAWMRVHARLGADIIKVCHKAMRIPGSVKQWEEWAEMPFPESGTYVVPGALNPIEIDREKDTGLYVEPNVWMGHAIR